MEFVNEAELKEIVEEGPVEKAQREDGESDIENDLEDWVEEDNVDIKSLFDDCVVHSIDELLSHDKDNYNFDLKLSIQDNCTDDIGIIKLINFIRAEVAAHDGAVDDRFIGSLNEKIESKVFLEGEVYMKPTIEDDQLLFMYEEAFLPADFEEDDA